MSRAIILVQNSLYPYDVGGHEVFNYHLYRHLMKYCDIKVMSHYDCPKYIDKSNYIKIPRILPLGLFSPIFYLYKLIKFRNSATLILTFSRSRWINWWPFPLVKNLLNIDYVLVVHGGGLTRWAWSFPYMWLFKNAGNVVGVSKKICSEYQMRTGEKLLNIPPLMPFIPAIESKDVIRRRWNIGDEHVFLSVGSLKELKNPFTVIEAAKHLGESFLKNNKICFFIAGDGGLKSSMLQKIKLYSLDAYFILSGNVEQSEISSIYKMADSYVISSKFEGTPLSLMDAMSNELNIIASNAPGINDMIFDEENGMLFEIDNYKDLSLKIKRHVGVGCVHYGSAAKRDYNNKYNYQDMLDQYLKILSL